MAEVDRDTMHRLNANRKLARSRLVADVADAKRDLHPRALLHRWTGKQKARIAATASDGARLARKNAPLLGLAGAAILLYAARKPILDMYRNLRDRAPEAEEQD